MGRSVKLSFGVVFFVIAILSYGRTCLADPATAITTPMNGQFITGASFDISGTASDDTGFGIQKVQVSINGSGWHNATDTSGGTWATWTYPLTVHASGLFSISSRVVVNNVSYPGAGANTLVTIPKHSIGGTTTYSGSKPGNIFVAAFGDPAFNEDPLAYVGPIALGAYNMTNVPDGTYYLGAIKAAVGSNGPIVQLTTPFGAYGGVDTPAPVVLSGANKTGINIALQDTVNNPLPSAYAEADYADEGDPSGNHMLLEFIYEDQNQLASSVSVTGAGLGSPLSLVFDSSSNEWVSWLSPSSNLDLGTNPASWPAPPQTYTFTVNLNAGGSEVHNAIVKRYLTDIPTVTSPSGDVTGNLVFSWLFVPAALQYKIRLSDSGFNQIWESPAPITGSSYTYNGPALVDGRTYSYILEARAGSIRSENGGGFTYHTSTDATKPTAAIADPKTGAKIGGSSYKVTGTASDNIAVQRVEISLDNGANWIATAAYDTSGIGSWSTWAFDWPLATTGSYTLKARAVDTSSNVQATPSTISATVDLTPPTSHITSPANNAALKTFPVTITGTAADNTGGSGVKTVEVGIPTAPDGGGAINWVTATGTATWTYKWNSASGDGAYNLTTRATDITGNVETPGPGITVSVDTTKPYSAITSPASGAPPVKGTSITVTGTAGDATSGVAKVEVSTNGGSTWTALTASATSNNWATWNYTWTLPATGTYTVKSRATDKAGNVETPGAGVSVTVDKTVPTVKVTSPLAGAVMPAALGTYSIPYSIQGTASDVGSGVQKVEVTTDNGATWGTAGGTASWSYPWSPVSDGSYTIKVRASDVAGNPSAVTTGPTVKVDRTAPSAAITAPANGAFITGASYIVKGTATDGTGSGLQEVDVSTDGGATWKKATGTAAWTYTWPLTGGDANYTIKVKAIDKALNPFVSSGITVTVDAKPTSIITSPTAGSAVNTPIVITGTASDGTGTVTKVEVTYNGTTWYTATGTTSWSYSWSPLPVDGAYTIKSRATDSTSQVETPGAGVSVKVDTKAPTTVISTPAAGAFVGANLTVKGTAADGTGSGVKLVECSIDGGSTWVPAVGTASWTCNLTVTTEGALTILARATDNVGNVQATPTSRAVKADITPATVAITAPADSAVITTMTYTIKGTAADNTGGSGLAKVEVSLDDGLTWKPVTGTASWTYAWTVTTTDTFDILARVTDKAGNVSDPVVIYIMVSPQVLSGTWTYKAVPYAGGTTKTGTFTMSITDIDGNGTISFGNTCHTVYSGGYFGMSAYFDTTNEAYNSCTGFGDMWFDMTDIKHGSGDWTTDNMYQITISR